MIVFDPYNQALDNAELYMDFVNPNIDDDFSGGCPSIWCRYIDKNGCVRNLSISAYFLYIKSITSVEESIAIQNILDTIDKTGAALFTQYSGIQLVVLPGEKPDELLENKKLFAQRILLYHYLKRILEEEPTGLIILHQNERQLSKYDASEKQYTIISQHIANMYFRHSGFNEEWFSRW